VGIMMHTELTATTDVRRGAFCLPLGKFDSGGLYRLLKSKDGNSVPEAKFVWTSRAPPRVQFFIWLLTQGRIQCRVNLVRKRILDSNICEVCDTHPESADHIIAGCPFASTFWAKLGVILPADTAGMVRDLPNINRPAGVPLKHFNTFIALCCWHLWKRRNSVVFRSELATIRQTMLACARDTKLWGLRLPKRDRAIADVWHGVFVSSAQ
jgi:hypothetical protein